MGEHALRRAHPSYRCAKAWPSSPFILVTIPALQTPAQRAAWSEEVLLTWQSGSGVALTSSKWAFSSASNAISRICCNRYAVTGLTRHRINPASYRPKVKRCRVTLIAFWRVGAWTTALGAVVSPNIGSISCHFALKFYGFALRNPKRTVEDPRHNIQLSPYRSCPNTAS